MAVPGSWISQLACAAGLPGLERIVMEHIGSIIPRSLNGSGGAVTPTRNSNPHASPKTLPELVSFFEVEEARDNPDIVTQTSSLRLTDDGLVEVPKLGAFAMNDWSRRQIASALGVRWDRWFENADAKGRAEELNRRLERASGMVRLRTRALSNPDPELDKGVDGELRALVSATYSPVSDARLGRHLIEALRPKDAELRLVRYDITDKTATYVVKLGDTYREGDQNAEIGDVWGGILVRNSGVGFASLLLSLHLTRLLCKNGMTAPIPDALLMKRRHRGIDDGDLKSLLAEKLQDAAGRLHMGQTRLRAAAKKMVENVRAEFERVLERAHLPQRLMPSLLSAYEREPNPSRFGISQAITLAAQALAPEERLDLEGAAGEYLAHN